MIDNDGNQKIDFSEFQKLMYKLSQKQEFDKIYESFSKANMFGDSNPKNKQIITKKELQKFYNKIQDQPQITDEDCQQIINSFGPQSEATQKSDKINYICLNREGFNLMLYSPNNSLFSPERALVH